MTAGDGIGIRLGELVVVAAAEFYRLCGHWDHKGPSIDHRMLIYQPLKTYKDKGKARATTDACEAATSQVVIKNGPEVRYARAWRTELKLNLG